jgi:hypothetical protein
MSSLKQLFLCTRNVKFVSAAIKRNALKDMVKWEKKKDIDDYESVSMSILESLDYINKEFITAHRQAQQTYTLDMSAGQKYPKYYIQEGVERYSPNDFRSHDAQFTQQVFRTNANFRYGNVIKKWETSLYKRHYDRECHADGLRDTRELNTLQRGYNMGKIFGPNDYESSDSIMYNY